MRVVSTIKFICERGLSLRDQNEIVGSSKNGNYLGILELIAKYDPFLSAHIKKHTNKESGHTNYLSSTICEELISLTANSVLNTIVTRLKMSKYYSVSVNSTPEEGHIDQLTIIFRYIENIVSVKIFLMFLLNSGHVGNAIAETLICLLDDYKIDIRHCREQSYNNSANMSGKYNGMQAVKKRVNNYSFCTMLTFVKFSWKNSSKFVSNCCKIL